jgi:hypothetical protein
VPPARKPSAPEVRLGRTDRNGIAPSFFALLERGIEREPALAVRLRGRVAFRFVEDISPMRVHFRARSVLVEDGDFRRPDVAVVGRLPDIIRFAATPSVRGVPNPARAGGRQAIASYARGRVRLEGDRKLARGLLRLLSLAQPLRSRARATSSRTP